MEWHPRGYRGVAFHPHPLGPAARLSLLRQVEGLWRLLNLLSEDRSTLEWDLKIRSWHWREHGCLYTGLCGRGIKRTNCRWDSTPGSLKTDTSRGGSIIWADTLAPSGQPGQATGFKAKFICCRELPQPSKRWTSSRAKIRKGLDRMSSSAGKRR